jgi:pilus assembly protein CpaB
MDRTRIFVIAGAALLLALLASVGAYKYLSSRNEMVEKSRLQTVGIVVAQVDIPLGSAINPNQVAIAPWPKDSYPKDALAEVKSAVGRTALRDYVRGEPIVESKLVPLNRATGLLSLKVPAGMRAFSVKVNEVVGVGGFIVPDTRVDVVVTTSPSHREQQEKVSKMILEDVRVLAAGQTIEQKENKPVTVNTVTLALLPEEAEKLALASNDGVIQLVMRNFADNVLVTTSGVDKGRLLSSFRNAPFEPAAVPAKKPAVRRVSRKAPSPAAASVPPQKTYVVEVIKGNKRTEEKVD